MISIIVPVYNVESYIVKCIDSILLQTYKDIEVVLIDNGSTYDSKISLALAYLINYLFWELRYSRSFWI